MQACQALGPRLRIRRLLPWINGPRSTAATSASPSRTLTGVDAFLRDFDMYFCKLFDGARHDSGDPFDWGEKMIAHYRRNRVDPRTQDADLLRPAVVSPRHPASRAASTGARKPRSASAPT